MKITEYSIAGGFKEIDFDVEWGEGELEGEWLKRAGFADSGLNDGLHSERDYGSTIVVYLSVAKNSDWFAIVAVGDCADTEYIAVRTRIDLMDLRIKLAPLRTIAVFQRFDLLVSLVEKAFHAWHGHDFEEACDDCDPYQAAADRRLAAQAAQRRAEVEKKKASGA